LKAAGIQPLLGDVTQPETLAKLPRGARFIKLEVDQAKATLVAAALLKDGQLALANSAASF
jgi:hypothetical protein